MKDPFKRLDRATREIAGMLQSARKIGGILMEIAFVIVGGALLALLALALANGFGAEPKWRIGQ